MVIGAGSVQHAAHTTNTPHTAHSTHTHHTLAHDAHTIPARMFDSTAALAIETTAHRFCSTIRGRQRQVCGTRTDVTRGRFLLVLVVVFDTGKPKPPNLVAEPTQWGCRDPEVKRDTLCHHGCSPPLHAHHMVRSTIKIKWDRTAEASLNQRHKRQRKQVIISHLIVPNRARCWCVV